MKLHSVKTAETHQALFEAYKKRLAEIEDFDDEEEEKNTSFERSFLHNAILLHTLWFEQIDTAREKTEAPFLEEILERRESDLKSFQSWMNGFAASAKPNGWVIWGWSYGLKTFVGFPIRGHDENVPLGVAPLLVIDCWEHSYMQDYELDFEAYLTKFWQDLDWEVIDRRHKDLVELFGFNLK